MREILFRGRRTDNGEWVEGLYQYYNWVNSITREFIETTHHILPIGYQDAFKVIPETVGQYTGLTDKNSKKIFEGDIVKREFTLWHGETKKTRETQFGVVVYSNKECGFRVKKKCNLRKPWDGDTIEVIGNIHDNPELLKGGE